MNNVKTVVFLALAVAFGGCVGGIDAKRPVEPTKPASIGGGPRDVPAWCSAYESPVPVEPATLPPPGSRAGGGKLEPCPETDLPPPVLPPPPLMTH
ncbi:MAG TPA: hypothetical protein VGL13_07880 [Polyangiaceae bacterium]